MSTETKPVPLFDSLRVDPKKVAEGVWIQHPETKDRFLTRRRWCPEHSRAWLQAKEDYEKQHGKGSSDTTEGQAFIDAAAMATGVIIGWELASDPSRPYDPAAMAAALHDPQLDDVRVWFLIHTEMRHNFRPGAAAGN